MPFPSIQLPKGTTETITYENTTGGSYDNNGQWNPGSTTTETFEGTILPLTEDDLKHDLGGTYSNEAYKLYTTTELEISQIITHDSIKYEIKEKDNRFGFTNYRDYTIVRVGDVIE